MTLRIWSISCSKSMLSSRSASSSTCVPGSAQPDGRMKSAGWLPRSAGSGTWAPGKSEPPSTPACGPARSGECGAAAVAGRAPGPCRSRPTRCLRPLRLNPLVLDRWSTTRPGVPTTMCGRLASEMACRQAAAALGWHGMRMRQAGEPIYAEQKQAEGVHGGGAHPGVSTAPRGTGAGTFLASCQSLLLLGAPPALPRPLPAPPTCPPNRTWAIMSMPPTSTAHLTPIPAPSASNCSAIWMASSRVGDSTSANRACGLSSRCCRGWGSGGVGVLGASMRGCVCATWAGGREGWVPRAFIHSPDRVPVACRAGNRRTPAKPGKTSGAVRYEALNIGLHGGGHMGCHTLSTPRKPGGWALQRHPSCRCLFAPGQSHLCLRSRRKEHSSSHIVGQGCAVAVAVGTKAATSVPSKFLCLLAGVAIRLECLPSHPAAPAALPAPEWRRGSSTPAPPPPLPAARRRPASGRLQLPCCALPRSVICWQEPLPPSLARWGRGKQEAGVAARQGGLGRALTCNRRS